MTRVAKRAEALTVRHKSGRTYEVSSGSEPGRWHIVRGAFEQPLGEWTCDCIGARGRRVWCSHKQALSASLGVEVVEAPNKPTSSSLRGAGGGGGLPPATQGIVFHACIPLIQSAVKVAGDGGVRLTIDVAESDYDAVMDFVRQARGRSFRLVPLWDDAP